MGELGGPGPGSVVPVRRDAASSSRSRLMLALVGLVALAGCRHRGGAWAEPSAPVSGSVELFVIGQAREGGATRAVARELERSLAAAAAAGRTPIVAWLGTDLGARGPDRAGRCPSPAQAHAGPALAELSRVVDAAVEQGASSYGLPGPDGWRCGLSELDAYGTELPYRQPSLAYVLRVSTAGEVALVSSCMGLSCTVEEPVGETLVELVALDFSFWHYPELAGDELSEKVLAQQASLLAALAEQAPAPRLLLSPIPVESASAHGQAGRKQRTGFRYLPEFVQQALIDGLFVGVLGALERDLQVSADLSDAIVRGDRSFVAAPIFEVVSGAAGGASHTIPTSRAHTLLPDLETEHPGFARLSISDNAIELRVHARVAGRWRVAGLELPLHPRALGTLRETPTILPCHSCDPQRGASDGDIFVPRGARRR